MHKYIKKGLFVVMCLIMSAISFAAHIDTFPFTVKPAWKTRIVFKDGTMLNGIATASTDSSITMIIPQRDSLGNKTTVTIPFTDVRKIKMRDKNSFTLAENMLLGAGVGFLLGFLISVQDCDDPDDECSFVERLFANSRTQSAVKVGFAFGVLGLGLGLLESDRVTFKFNLGRNKKEKMKMPIF